MLVFCLKSVIVSNAGLFICSLWNIRTRPNGNPPDTVGFSSDLVVFPVLLFGTHVSYIQFGMFVAAR